MVRFEWDSSKDQANQRKYGLSFAEASQLFESAADYLEIYDQPHSGEQDRFLAIGATRAGVVVVAFTESREDAVRIVGARNAVDSEVRLLRHHLGGSHVI